MRFWYSMIWRIFTCGFLRRPENALGKMQLRSFMNVHSRQGERLFPFCVDRGFVRSHKMQRKHYRGLSNPQCVHGIELVKSPEVIGLDESEKKRLRELTGRVVNFSLPEDASDFGSWRNLPVMDFEIDRPALPLKGTATARKAVPETGLNFPPRALEVVNCDGVDFSHVTKKQRNVIYFIGGSDNDFLQMNSPPGSIIDIETHSIEPVWSHEFTGVMKNNYGPMTASKNIYEDGNGFLIIVSPPLCDLQRVRVTWKNDPSHGTVKIASVSTACLPLIKRHGRIFKLADPLPEHCPPGEFIRQISLPSRIPDDAELEAYYDETGTMLEIMVPKQHAIPEELGVPVSLRPSLWV